MTDRHSALIDELTLELAPCRPMPRVDWMVCAWLLLAAVYVVGVTAWFGPIRATAMTQLASEPRFLLETLLGLAAISLTAFVAFRASVPAALGVGLARLATVAMVLWLSSYFVGLYSPALEPSMAGKRPHCLVETFVFALPLVAGAGFLLRRLYPLEPLRTALGAALAAAMLPALYMQIACMYSPAHILQFHILPAFAAMLLGGGLLAVGLQWGQKRP